MKTIVFLNLAVLPYHVAVFRAIIARGYRLVVYYNAERTTTSYRAPAVEGLTLLRNYDYPDAKALYADAAKYKPECVVTAGWINRDYNRVCRKFRKAGVKTLAVSDTQWRGGRQWLNRLAAPFRHKRWFDYVWAAGILQFDYARHMGFPPSRILMNCFSGDLDTFLTAPIEEKRARYPKRFLYVGRFVGVKGIDVLLKAWDMIADKRGWTLELVGDGPLKETFRRQYPDVIIKDFMSQEELIQEVRQSGCFILVSRFEPWALVLQEFAAAGMPIVCTRQCGAAWHFALNGYNGYTVDAEDAAGTAAAMRRIIGSSDDELVTMSLRSRQLGTAVNPDVVASTLISIL